MKHWFISLLFVSMAQVVSSQIEFRVDSTRLFIGDQINAILVIPLSSGQTWLNEKTLWPDSLTGIEKIGEGEIQRHADKISAVYKLSFFDSGRVVLPPLPVVLSGRADTQWTPPIPVEVMVVEPDSLELQPIKGISEEPFRPGYYLRYWPYALGLLLIGGLLWYYLKKRKPAPVIEEAPILIPISADVWALGELELLEQRSLWQRGEIKAYYTRLTDIFREYLERQFHIHAREQTTDEIQDQFSKLNFSKERVKDVGELLQIADMIKFAKADPGTSVHEQAINRVRDFIRSVDPASYSNGTSV